MIYRVLASGITLDGRETSIICPHKHETIAGPVDCRENWFWPGAAYGEHPIPQFTLQPGWEIEIYRFPNGTVVSPEEIRRKLQ